MKVFFKVYIKKLMHFPLTKRAKSQNVKTFDLFPLFFYKYHFGFHKHYSTNPALISIAEKICDALDKNMYTCGVCIDLEKAFHTVNHQILLSKLNYYGIANKTLSSAIRAFPCDT